MSRATRLILSEGCVGTVVEDYAVLQHLGNRKTIVLGCPHKALACNINLHVDGTSKESTLGANDKLTGVEGFFDCAIRRSFSNLTEL